MSDLTIVEARWPQDRGTVLALFRDYVAGLGIDLGFQGVEAEFATLPGKYARPGGLVLLAWRDGAAVGTVAYRPQAPGACEMKRLYVAPAARQSGVGRQLCDRLIAEARATGYHRMLLDTGDWLTPALALYRALGFAEIPAYYHNPLKGTVYMARDLQD